MSSVLRLALSSLLLAPAVLASEGEAVTGGSGTGAAAAWPAEHWGYEGSAAPHFWDEVDPKANAMCASGTHQSPINLMDEETTKVIIEKPTGDVAVSWKNINGTGFVTFANLGHTLQVGTFPSKDTTVGGKTANPSTITYKDKTFTLLQFHFHTPSEHHVMNKFSPMEVHFVHATTSGELAVLGIFLELSETNTPSPFLAQMMPLMNQVKNNQDATPLDGVNINTALTEAGNLANGFYTYGGSLTTPKCAEGVHWIVAKNSIRMSNTQWNAFKQWMGYSARQTQRRLTADDLESGASQALVPGFMVIASIVAQLLF